MLRSLALAAFLVAAADPASTEAPDTMLVLLRGDALTVDVTFAVKKNYTYRPRRLFDAPTHQVRYVSELGETIATTPIAIRGVDLDPEHVGQPAIRSGCCQVVHEIQHVVQIPALKDFDHLVIERLVTTPWGAMRVLPVGAITHERLALILGDDLSTGDRR